MPRGQPDYHSNPYQVSVNQADAGFSMPFMFGRASIDARGRVVWVDNFRYGIGAWKLLKGGSGSYPVAATTLADIPPNAMKLEVDGGASTDYSAARHEWGLNILRSIGIEYSLFLNNDDSDYDVSLVHYLDGVVKVAQWKITKSPHVLSIRTPTGYVDIANIPDDTGYMNYLQYKLVADFVLGKYVRLLIGDLEYDISNYELYSAASAYSGYVYFRFSMTSGIAVARTSYLGYAILTYDEP